MTSLNDISLYLISIYGVADTTLSDFYYLLLIKPNSVGTIIITIYRWGK